MFAAQYFGELFKTMNMVYVILSIPARLQEPSSAR